jgi:hypothetical protein
MPTDRPHLSPITPGLPCLPALSSFLLRVPLPTTPETTAWVAASAVPAGRLVRGLRTASPRIPRGSASGGPTP